MPIPRKPARYLRDHVNRVTLRFTGHAAFADLEHVGRRSGTVRHTPVRAFRVDDKIVIGLNFGRGSDWLKNIQAAGGCRIRLGSEHLELGAPRLVPVEQGTAGIPRVFRIALRYLVRTVDCVELPIIGRQHGDRRSSTGSPSTNRSARAPQENPDQQGPALGDCRPKLGH